MYKKEEGRGEKMIELKKNELQKAPFSKMGYKLIQ